MKQPPPPIIIVDEALDIDPKIYDHIVSPKPEEDPRNDPEYQEFMEDVSDACGCCPSCAMEFPCGSCMAGGPCDNHDCTCGCEDEDFYEYGDDPV